MPHGHASQNGAAPGGAGDDAALSGSCLDDDAQACDDRQATADIVERLNGRASQWKKPIEAYRQALAAAGCPQQRSQLQAAKRARFSFRREGCGHGDSQESIRAIAAAIRMLDMTQAQARETCRSHGALTWKAREKSPCPHRGGGACQPGRPHVRRYFVPYSRSPASPRPGRI